MSTETETQLKQAKYLSPWRRYLNDFVIPIELLRNYMRKRFSEGKGVFGWRWYAHQPDLGANVHRVMPVGVLYPEAVGTKTAPDYETAKKQVSPPRSFRMATPPT